MGFDYAEWVQDNLEKAKPSSHGEWTATCPECTRFGSFYINCTEDGDGPFVCFKCGFSGKRFAPLIAKVEGVSTADAIRIMGKKAVAFARRDTVGSLRERIRCIRVSGELDWDSVEEAAPSDPTRRVDYALPHGFVPVWDGKVWRMPDYLTDRDFYRETARDWGMGFVNRGWFPGVKDGKEIQIPLKRRVIIPVDCPNGRSWSGRTIDKDGIPKYRNPDGADHSRLLFGWGLVPERADFALVEGQLDAAKLYQHEIPSMATGGKALSLAQLGMLFKRPAESRVVVMYDPDALINAYAAAQQLIVHYTHVYVAHLPDLNKRGEKSDPGNSSRKQAHRWFDDARRFRGERAPRTVMAVTESLAKAARRYR